VPRWRPARFALGATLLAVSYAEARRPDLPPYEERVFRAANRLPHGIRAPVRTVMQAGTFATVPAVAVVAGILADELPRPVRPFLWSVPVATAFGRMYVGAHLPHDTLGGAGFGLMLSSLVPRR